MGMFDYVAVEVGLPDGWTLPHGEHFQTKDLTCCLLRYKIDVAGQLWREDVEYEECDPGPEPPANAPLVEKLRWIGGGRRVKSWTWVIEDHLGYVVFYTNDEAGAWREYRAKIIDGVCVELTTVERVVDP